MTQPSADIRNVVVAGAGLAGLTAAVAAVEAGFRVILLEEGAGTCSDSALYPGCRVDAAGPEETFDAQMDMLLRSDVDIRACSSIISLDGAPPALKVTLRTGSYPLRRPGPLELARDGRLQEAREAAFDLNPFRGSARTRGCSLNECGYALPGECGGTVETLDAAALIIAGAAVESDAASLGEYGWGRYPDLVTRSEFERMPSQTPPVRPSDGRVVTSAAFIQCAGSRSARLPAREWCSAVCCRHSMEQALRVRRLVPGCRVKIFHMDLMAVELAGEALAASARREGVGFVRSLPAAVREKKPGCDLILKYVDDAGATIEEEFELVVLSTGLDAPRGLVDMARRIGVETDAEGFVRPTGLLPCGTSRRGVFAAGPAAGPADTAGTAAGARAAAARAVALTASAPRHTRGEGRTGPEVLIIGGGLAGMSAALVLSRRGVTSSIVEREAAPGGCLRLLGQTADGRDASALLEELAAKVRSNELIQLITDATAEWHEGSPGAFRTVISAAGASRPVEHAALIIASGAAPYHPREYMYGSDARVITQHELEGELAGGTGCEGPLVMIQCVGSRNQAHPWCGRICCAQAVKNALAAKRLRPDLPIAILHRDVRTFGRLDLLYHEARAMGVRFVRFAADEPPAVETNADGLVIKAVDCDLAGEVTLGAARLVLSAGVMPQKDSIAVGELFGVASGAYGFLQGYGKAVDIVRPGVYLCGMVHGPLFAHEAACQALSAAGRAAAFLEARGKGCYGSEKA